MVRCRQDFTGEVLDLPVPSCPNGWSPAPLVPVSRRVKLPVGARFQAIKSMFLGGCGNTLDAIIDLALPALGSAIWILFIPSPGEVIENFLEPKAFRGRGRFPGPIVRRGGGAPGGGLFRAFDNVMPDVDELIGKKLQILARFKGIGFGLIGRWIWTGINIADLVGLAFLLADIADDGTILWTSNIMEAKFCDSPFDFVGQFSCTFQTIGGFVWQHPCNPSGMPFNQGGAAFNLVVPDGKTGDAQGDWKVVITIDCTGPGCNLTGQGDCQMRVRGLLSNQVIGEVFSPVVTLPEGTHEVSAQFDFQGVDKIEFRWVNTPSAGTCRDSGGALCPSNHFMTSAALVVGTFT